MLRHEHFVSGSKITDTKDKFLITDNNLVAMYHCQIRPNVSGKQFKGLFCICYVPIQFKTACTINICLKFGHVVGFISPYKYNRKVDLTLLIRSPVQQKIPVSSTVIGRP